LHVCGLYVGGGEGRTDVSVQAFEELRIFGESIGDVCDLAEDIIDAWSAKRTA